MTVAYYARKSNDKKNDSVENQLAIIERHIKRQNDLIGASIIKYSDDGASGINVDRDNFQELLAKVREREIDVIAVKDLSRLGRNYLDVIKLIDSIFPFMGVRVIAVSDGYDSKHKTDLPMNLPIALKAILNEYHVVETSEKSRKSFAHRIRNGAFYGNILFGYYFSDERKPVIDEEKAKTVREIFGFRLDGLSTLEIARKLNDRKILTNRGKEWTASAVLRILTSKQYIGIKVALASVKDIKTKQRKPAKGGVYVNENAFPAIVEKEVFDKVQESFPRKPKPFSPESHIMARKLYCGHCRKSLRRNKNFSCAISSLTGAAPCFEGTVKRDELYPEVLKIIKAYIGKEIEASKWHYSSSDKVKLETEIDRLKERKAAVFEEYFAQKITDKEFAKQKSLINVKITEAKTSLESLRRRQAMCTKLNGEERPIDTLKRLYNADELTKEHMQFVKIINVYDKDNYDIILYEDSPLTVLCRNISIYEEV